MRQQGRKAAQIGGVVMSALVVMSSRAAAEDDGAVAVPAATEATANAPAPSTPSTPFEEMRAMLDGTTWEVEWASIGGNKKGKPYQDSLTFTKMTVVSGRLSKSGYPETNYTLTVPEDGPAVWETMQTKEGTGIAFLRGEVSGSSMQGVISMHPKEGSPEDFAFSGRQAGAGSPAPAVEAPAAPSQPDTSTTAASPPAPSAPEAPKKKRKGWFGR